MPRQTLAQAVIRLQVGSSYALEALAAQLAAAGYSRCDMVEGPGQFALRGGILDVYSPGSALPVRAEFFGDELDAMGYFDLSSQRRVENLSQAQLLPVAEVLPGLHPGALEGLGQAFAALAGRLRRRKHPPLELLATMQKDLDRMQQGLSFAAADRYLRLIYPPAPAAGPSISPPRAWWPCATTGPSPGRCRPTRSSGAWSWTACCNRGCWPGSWQIFLPAGTNFAETWRAVPASISIVTSRRNSRQICSPRAW